jgi:CRP-like cAMP-binding protein
MKHRRFPADLRRKVARYFKKYFETKTVLNEDIVLQELDEDLRHEVGLFLCQKAVANNYLFIDMPRGMLLKLGAVLRPVTAAKGDIIITAGDEGTDMFIILSGEVAVLANDGYETILHCLTPGSAFGENAAFDISPLRRETVKTLDACEFFRVSQEDLRSAFRDAPGVYESMHLKAIAKLTGEIEEAKLSGGPDAEYAMELIKDLSQRHVEGSESAGKVLAEIQASGKRLRREKMQNAVRKIRGIRHVFSLQTDSEIGANVSDEPGDAPDRRLTCHEGNGKKEPESETDESKKGLEDFMHNRVTYEEYSAKRMAGKRNSVRQFRRGSVNEDLAVMASTAEEEPDEEHDNESVQTARNDGAPSHHQQPSPLRKHVLIGPLPSEHKTNNALLESRLLALEQEVALVASKLDDKVDSVKVELKQHIDSQVTKILASVSQLKRHATSRILS